MQETIQRYQRHTKDVQTDNSSVEENMQHLKHEAADMAKQIELLEVAKRLDGRKLLGDNLGSCTMEELQQIEQQLEWSVSRVRAKKMEVFMEQIDQLKEKEKVLTAENAKLCEKRASPQKVEYLPVVSPLENQKENAVHFAKRTGHAIATALNVVQTGHVYGDFMLFAKAAESKQ
ncbi:unnamed protein product [Camellia sinensis]